MAQCITCGTELHPERAQKYDYCMAPECQEKNAEGLTMVAVGMNKAADELMILDDRTRQSFGTSASAPPAARTAPRAAPAGSPAHPARATHPARRSRPAPRPKRGPWTGKQERLALLYNEQGLRPDEIADKLGVSRYLATQIILTAKNRGKI
jgi:DNA-directed RNA polymerase subunit N (RpoN/RPB10)